MEEKKALVGKRRSDRILAPIRIRVIGNDGSGVSFVEETVTVSLNQQGARISLTHSLLPDDIVLILNRENNIEEEFRVVGSFQQVIGDRREWGAEAGHRDSKALGIKFKVRAEGTQTMGLAAWQPCTTAHP